MLEKQRLSASVSLRPTLRCREAEVVEFQSNISKDRNLSPFLPSDMKQANVRLILAEQLINLLFTCIEVTSENSEVSPRLQSIPPASQGGYRWFIEDCMSTEKEGPGSWRTLKAPGKLGLVPV